MKPFSVLRRPALAMTFAAFATCVSACGSKTALPPQPQRAVEREEFTAVSSVSTNIIVKVPAAASSAKSISIAVNGGTPVVANLASGSAGCAVSSTTPLTCTVAVVAPATMDTFVIKTFSAAGAAGTQLAAATLLQAVSATAAPLKLSLAGPVAALSLQLGRSSAMECAAATKIPLYVRAKDAAGNTIVAASYGVTIALTDSDTSGATQLSATTLTGSASALNVAYNGHKIGPSARITASATGLTAAAATLNFNQQLYVLDANNQYIQAFASTATGNVAPSRIINERGRMTAQARQIAVSPSCLLYAADGGNNSVFAFPAGSSGAVAPVATIAGTNTLLNGPQGVAIDSTGKIYASIYNSTSRLGGVGVWNAGATGNVAPATTILGANTQIGHPASMAFDAAGNLYVLDFRKVVVFAKGASGNVAPLRVLLTPSLYCENGMSVDPSGKIYIADCSNTVSIYAAGASGTAAPVRVINTGASTGPVGMAIDYTGDAYVALQRIPSVVSYSPAATGTVAARTSLSGANTTFNLPFNVAF